MPDSLPNTLQDDVDVIRPAPQAIPDKRTHGVNVAKQFLDPIINHRVDMVSPSHVITTFLTLKWLA